MAFVFPNLPKLSLWDIACGHTGQNAADSVPTNETRHKLAELVKDASEHRLWVEFVTRGDDSGLFSQFLPAAPHAAADADWRKLNDVTVRREDWERYSDYRMVAAPDTVAPAYMEQPAPPSAQTPSAHVWKMVELINNGDEFIDWEFWAGKMPRWNASQAVRLLAALDPAKHQDLTFKRAETAGAAKEQAARLEMLAVSHDMTEASPLAWLRWADTLNEPVHDGCRAAVVRAIEKAHTSKLIEEQAEMRINRQPARLFGEGFSEEMRRQTTLTRYLQFDTWTPAAAAMLVCGLQAPIIDGQLCVEIPEKGAMGLDNCFVMSNQDPFHDAKRVLGIWRSQEAPPVKVRPLDFIGWCKWRGFDTSWLRSIEADASNGERADMKAALGTGVVVVPSAPLISAAWLAGHIAFSLVPIPDDEQLTTVFKVTTVKQAPGLIQTKREALTGTDWSLVRSICGNPPASCSRMNFDEWRGRFDAATHRPAWSLEGEFRESAKMMKAQARWSEISIAHREQIAQKVRDGDLSLVTPEGITTDDTSTGLIRREDVMRYLDSHKVPWRDAHGKATDAGTRGSPNGQPKIVVPSGIPDACELSTINLTSEQWDGMTGQQRQGALQAIADTKACSEQIARQEAERRALGRYTLNEAADAIAATGERFAAVLEKLQDAAQRHDLPTYAPGERARYEYTNGKQVRPFYEEAYWNDLNGWLERYESRITFRFPRPATALGPNSSAVGTVNAKPCPKEFTLYWLNRKLDGDASFAEQAVRVLQRMSEQTPTMLHETTTPASAASALLNEWLVNRDLPCYMRGRLIDDFAALTLEPRGCDLSNTMDIIDGSIHVRRDDLVRLVVREGMTVPHFLTCGNPPESPAQRPAREGRPQLNTVALADAAALNAGEVAPIARPVRTTSHTLKGRSNLLTPVIQRVAAATKSFDSNVVFPPLREMAIGEEAPFNGVDNSDGALLWTDANGSLKRLTKRALAERLRNLSKRSKAG